MPFGQAAAVGAMPPKKSNEEQRLAGKQKLEAFKRQKAEAAAAKAAGKNTGIVEISEPSNPVEVPEPVLVTESSTTGVTATDVGVVRPVTEAAPAPDPPTPAPTWTTATATPFGTEEIGTAGTTSPQQEEKNAHPSEVPPVPTGQKTEELLPHAPTPPPLDGHVFLSLPGSNPGSPSPSFANLGHISESKQDDTSQMLQSEIKSLKQSLEQALSECAAAQSDLAASRRAGADAAAARARAEGERDASIERATTAERDTKFVSEARKNESTAAASISDLRSKLDEMSAECDELRATLKVEKARVLSAETNAHELTKASTEMSQLITQIETKLESEKQKRKTLELKINQSNKERDDIAAERENIAELSKESDSTHAAKMRVADARARHAEDEQIKAEEDAAALRVELEAAREELAEALETQRNTDQSGTSENERDTIEQQNERDSEQYAFVAEIKGLSKKLEAARAAAKDAEDEKNELEKKTEKLTSEVFVLTEELKLASEEIEFLKHNQSKLEQTVADVTRRVEVAETRASNQGGEDSTKDDAIDKVDGQKTNPDDSKNIRNLEEARDEARLETSAARAELKLAIEQRDEAVRNINLKIKQHNESQDMLLVEIDSRDDALEKADVQLDEALRRATTAEEKVQEALAQAQQARVQNERLVEMLEEQAVWGEVEDAREKERRRQGAVSAPATPEKSSESSETKRTASTVPSTPNTYSNANLAQDSPSVRLAAEILQGSELGKAYHPLLASIEARLLHLSEDKLVS